MCARTSCWGNGGLQLGPSGILVINVVPGGVKSNIGNSAISSYSHMPEWELYRPFEAAIWIRACLFQGPKTNPIEEFAKKTVATVLKKNPPAWFSFGHFSTIMSITYHFPLCVIELIRLCNLFAASFEFPPLLEMQTDF
ncbi:hypothetical protein SADUNF_Sadunf05G0054200 [Salix dunnii]|uniref:Uncharacterized protein n=1 Tax=Salix dunnii TaxID=1413687 RepID=A0A835K6Y8_9ROSI|nr:hypothetical protein SADUNF_Sadunf05G0054200 [Salix dunnii]